MSDNDFAHSSDECIRNPAECQDGLSFSIFYKPDYAETETDSALADPSSNFEREYILSNGGDVGSPGFSIYREGDFFVQIYSYEKIVDVKVTYNKRKFFKRKL